MTADEILIRHEPEDLWTTGGDYEGIECAYCTPRQLRELPFPDWQAFAEHLAKALEEAR